MSSVDVRYTSKDFDAIKLDLINLLKQNFPNDWADFNESNPAMSILEMFAYIGDNLNYNIDKNINEVFSQRSKEPKNILANAEGVGYKPKHAVPAITTLSVSAVIPASTSGQTLFTLSKGTRVITNFEPSVSFEIIEDVDFSLSAKRTIVNDGTYITASVSSVSAVAGQSRSYSVAIGEPTPFLKITLPDEDITEIVSVSGSDESEWVEVPFLNQETIFSGDINTTSNSGDITHILRLKRVPRRFVTQVETGAKTSLVFGSGTLNVEDADIIPNPEDFVLPPSLRGSPSGFIPSVINSTNFLKTKTMGLAPRNITLDIDYRYGGGLDTNVASNTLTEFRDKQYTFNTANIESVSSEVTSNIIRSLSVTNPEKATGGRERETPEEIRRNASAYYASQDRAVTLPDYQVRIMSMPSCFGSVFRSFARKDPKNNLGIELLIVSKNSDDQLISSSQILKNNIGTYLNKFKSVNDSIRITDGTIVNIGIDFTIVPQPNINGNIALINTILLLKQIFSIKNTNFNDTIIIPDIIRQIQSLDDVQSVSKLSFNTFTGTVDGREYTDTAFDIQAVTANGIISFPENVIASVKFLDFDITGRFT